MKLLAWNIQHGGGIRQPRIVEEIAAYDPDVVAVTEFRVGPGVALCACGTTCASCGGLKGAVDHLHSELR